MTGTLRGWVPPTVTSAEPDAELIRKTRAGDNAAYGELYQRHADAAHRLASRFATQASDRDDLVATVFTDVLAAIRHGAGPVDSFRPYLLVSVRRAAARLATKPAHIELDESGVAVTDDSGDPVVAAFERDSALRAFASLPGRWQTVLWHTVVEGESPAQVAPYLGLTPNAVSTLASRAREGLRQAFVAQHVREPSGPETACTVSRDQLAAYTRGALSKRGMARIRGHLDACPTCRDREAELADVDATLTRKIAPAVLAVPLTAYLAPLSPLAQTGTAVLAAGRLGFLAKVAASLLVGVLAVTGLIVLRPDQPDPAIASNSQSSASTHAPSVQAPSIEVPVQDEESAQSGAQTPTPGAVLAQTGTPVVAPGSHDVIRLIVSPPAGQSVTLHAVVPLSTTPAPTPVGSACTLVSATQVECRDIAERAVIDIPIDVAASASWDTVLSGGSAWMSVAGTTTTVGSAVPLTVRTQQQDCAESQ